MNDIDDYDFGSVENSNLSSIFGRDNFSEATNTNNSLVYKAPKQPIASKNTKVSAPNFSYKYINLYEIVGDVQQKFGKHIICLLRPETNTPEILIYQNKKNILIRNSIETIYISIDPEKKYCLNLLTNKRNFSLEYNSQEDYASFISEFTSIGGKIQKTTTDRNESKPKNQEISDKKDLPLLHPTTVLSSLKSSESVLDSIEVEENMTIPLSDETQDKTEKEVILARLAKMGLPQLPSLQKDVSNNSSKILTNTTNDINVLSTSNNSGSEQIHEKYKEENSSELARIKHDCSLIPRKMEDNQEIQMLNRPIDPITFMLAENRLNNAELRHQLSLLTSNMNKINSEPLENKTDDQLRSKLRAYKMKSENLESELDRIKRKYAELQKLNEELLEVNNSNVSASFHNIDSAERSIEINVYKSNIKEMLDFIKNLPLKTEEIDLSTLRNIKENIEDEELISILENSISFIQNKIDSQKHEHDNSVSKMRTDFLKGTKHIMNNLYSKTSNLLDDEMKKVLAEDIRSTMLELVRNYDEKIHNTI